MCFGSTTTEANYCFHHILSRGTWYSHDITSDVNLNYVVKIFYFLRNTTYVKLISTFSLLLKKCFMETSWLRTSCVSTSHLKLLPFISKSKEIKQLEMIISRGICHGKEDMQRMIETYVSSKYVLKNVWWPIVYNRI